MQLIAEKQTALNSVDCKRVRQEYSLAVSTGTGVLITAEDKLATRIHAQFLPPSLSLSLCIFS